MDPRKVKKEMETEAGSIILEAFRELHHRIRKTLENVSEEKLNRRPSEETNSVAVIVTHLLGSERETLSAVAGLQAERDRDAEFRVTGITGERLARMLDAADELIDEVGPLLDEGSLAAHVRLPTLVGRVTEPSGIERLIYNFGHAREHFGELSVTLHLLNS